MLSGNAFNWYFVAAQLTQRYLFINQSQCSKFSTPLPSSGRNVVYRLNTDLTQHEFTRIELTSLLTISPLLCLPLESKKLERSERDNQT